MAVLTDDAARQQMETHHGQLIAALTESVAEFEHACLDVDGSAAEDVAARLQSLLDGDILPHAAGEERSFYPAAKPYNDALVESLLGEHDVLRSLIEACKDHRPGLASAAGRLQYLGLAHEISALFRTHAHKEDRFVTPIVLAHMPAGTVARLFTEMHAPAGG